MGRHIIERIVISIPVLFGVLLIGFFLAQAGWQADSSEAKGLGGALATLAQQPYGPWLLGITALGLICYGIYCGVVAGYADFARA